MLEERLIDFAVIIIGMIEALPNPKAGSHIANQLARSGTSPAPDHSEAKSAESRKDFIHKLKISLKELRETMIWLKIIARKRMCDIAQGQAAIAECDELVALLVRSTNTADENSRFDINIPKSTFIKHQSDCKESGLLKTIRRRII